MSRRSTSWLGGLLGGSEQQDVDRFSIEHLRHLRDVLIHNPRVNDDNRDAVVEALRSIAELMVWGDQHDPKFLEYFLENNILQHFTNILQQRSNRRGEVAIQVLQTLSMLIQNIQSKTAIFYMFSNNHINEVVGMHFDFDDEEVLGHYITLLKSISLKLNKDTVQFFYDKGSFPLYSEAIKLINHHDGMVRAAVRTLTLKVYHIRDPAVQSFVISQPASHYFSRLATYVADQCQVLDHLLTLLGDGSATATYNVDSCLAEVEDLLSYCNDILSTGANGLASLVLQCLWESFALPVIVNPLVMSQQAAAPRQQPPSESRRVHPVCSLHVLERLLSVMSFTPFIDLLVSLLCPHPHSSTNPNQSSQPQHETDIRASSGSFASTSQPSGLLSQQHSQALSQGSLSETAAGTAVPAGTASGLAATAEAGAAAGRCLEESPWQALFALHEHSTAFRACLVQVLQGKDPQLICAAVRALAAVVQSKAASAQVLASAGLLPVRQQRHRDLMNALVGGESSDPDALFGTPQGSSSPAGKQPQQRRFQTPSQAAAEKPQPHTNGHRNHDSPSQPNRPNQEPMTSSNGATHSQYQHQQAVPHAQQQGQSQAGQGPMQPPGQSQEAAAASGQLVDALFAVLQQPLLPSSCLWQVGWLLSQLLAHAQSGIGQLVPHHQKQLEQARQGCQAGLVGNLQGMWCDAVPALVFLEWQAARQAICQPPAASTAAAVQAWLQESLWFPALTFSKNTPSNLHICLVLHTAQGASGLGCRKAILVQELGSSRGGQGGPPQPGQGSQSAQAARHVLQAVHTFVALIQIQQVLLKGEIREQAPVAAVTDSMLRGNELREGALVGLDQQVTCSVAFSRGEERRVFFAIHGLPQGSKELQGAAAQAALATAAASSMASVVLADPGQQHKSGLVLSLAPLMGAAAQVDSSHPKWLHVHVRPPVRGLLKLLKNSGSGSALLNISRQLIDGHWVLSFASPQQAQYAQDMVEQHSARLRTLYGEALLPMLTSPQTL